MVTVAVLGHRGMLGSVVARYFAEQGADVVTTDLRYDGSDTLPAWATQHDVVVNCIGTHDGNQLVNGLLPVHLAEMVEERYTFVSRRPTIIHPSTDAVHEDTPYARSKRMGDRANAVIVRAGIVDITRQPVAAYDNWFCNPITPLEWAERAYRLHYVEPGVHEYGRETLTRYAVAMHVADVFGGPHPEKRRADAPLARIVTDTSVHPGLWVALTKYRDWLRAGETPLLTGP